MSLSLYKIHLSFHCPRQPHPHSRSQPPSCFLLHWENRGQQRADSLLSHPHDSLLPWPGSLALLSLQLSTMGVLCVLLAKASPSSWILSPTQEHSACNASLSPLSPDFPSLWAAKILSNIHSQSSPLLPSHEAALIAALTQLPSPSLLQCVPTQSL